jgi:hypothetical protein
LQTKPLSVLQRRSLLVPKQLPLQTTPTFGLGVRLVASQVSNRPASQSIPHAAQNIKEEMGHAIEDMAQAIAGGKKPTQLGSTGKDIPLEGGFVGLTSAIASTVPT